MASFGASRSEQSFTAWERGRGIGLPSAITPSLDMNELACAVVLETDASGHVYLQNRQIRLMRAFAAIWLAIAASASVSAGHFLYMPRRIAQTDICFRSRSHQLKSYTPTLWLDRF